MFWVFLLAGISPAEPSVKLTRERGGVVVETRTLILNHLGQATEDHLEGTGVAERNHSPVIRDDGSLSSVSLTIGGATASASFNANGTLSAFTHPALGPLAVFQGFANGTETLTVLSSASRLEPPAEATRFTTVAYLRRLRQDLADRLNPADHTAIREQIDAIQAAYFGKTPPQNLNLPAILAEWSATARKRT